MNVHVDVPDVSKNREEPEVLAALRRFARARPPVERCELCGAALEPEHVHLLHHESRQIACGCDACAVLFCSQEGGKFLRIPKRIRELEDFAFSDLEWEAMMLPIHLAFFVRDEDGKVAAMYPSPAGAVASQLGMESLKRRFAEHPALERMEPEVETLLVNRNGEGSYFIVPIDECYRLVEPIRTRWRGLSGGVELWAGIEGFFGELKRKSERKVRHA
jgi:hypothetical protein